MGQRQPIVLYLIAAGDGLRTAPVPGEVRDTGAHPTGVILLAKLLLDAGDDLEDSIEDS